MLFFINSKNFRNAILSKTLSPEQLGYENNFEYQTPVTFTTFISISKIINPVDCQFLIIHQSVPV